MFMINKVQRNEVEIQSIRSSLKYIFTNVTKGLVDIAILFSRMLFMLAVFVLVVNANFINEQRFITKVAIILGGVFWIIGIKPNRDAEITILEKRHKLNVEAEE